MFIETVLNLHFMGCGCIKVQTNTSGSFSYVLYHDVNGEEITENEFYSDCIDALKIDQIVSIHNKVKIAKKMHEQFQAKKGEQNEQPEN